MSKKCVKVIITIGLLSSIMVSIAGCGSVDVMKLDLVPQLTENEVVDYYKKALEYDTIVSKNLDVKETTFNVKECGEDKKVILSDMVDKVQGVLGGMDYPVDNKEIGKLITENNYHYIKAFLDDKVLINARKVNYNQAIGFYFVDVEYDVLASETGFYKPEASLLGINGAFKKDLDGNDLIDTTFLEGAVRIMNRTYVDNKENTVLSFDAETKRLNVQTDEEETKDKTKYVDKTRISDIDIRTFNDKGGSSIKQSAYMPELNLVYAKPTNTGLISGNGLYPGGNGGLREFGFTREKYKGTCKLRYVFKDSEFNTNEIEPVNVYPIDLEMVNGVSQINNPNVPDFVYGELEKLIERYDRAVCNGDITSLMYGEICPDIGKAVLAGYDNNFTNLQKNMSTIRSVLARGDNTYLLNVETFRQEGPIGSNSYGNYRDNHYITVEQVGTNFYITDDILMNRKMVKEPNINEDSAIIKRLVALNLSGEVSESNRNSINGLMDNFYKACSSRKLTVTEDEIKKEEYIKAPDGTDVTVGIYDCFNDDVSLLSSTRKEYITGQIKERLVRYGTNVASYHNGVVTEWLGGADRQVEFTTEELVTYEGRNEAVYLQVYYLVSNMNDKWVIDEVNIIEEEVLKDKATIENVKERVGTKYNSN